MALKDAIDEIIDELQTIEGIKRVPEEPPESNSAFPFVVVLPGTGDYHIGPPELMRGLHNVNIELHVARKDLPRDYLQVMNLIDTIPKELYNKLRTSGFNYLSTFGQIDYIFGPLSWAAVDTLGVTYTIEDLKIQTDVTT